MRHFLNWAESAARLGTDEEGLRQALQLELWEELRAYVRSSDRPFIGTMAGDGAVLTDGQDGPYTWSTWDSDAPTHLKNGKTLPAWGGRDVYCSWEKLDTSQAATGYPAVYLITGFLRIYPTLVRQAAQEGRWSGMAVTPPLWWKSEHSPVPLDTHGQPEVYFMLLDRGETTGHCRPPGGLEELWFNARDIEKLASKLASPLAQAGGAEAAKRPKLRSDREQNLLRVIAALWAMSDLPKEHNVAADKLSALMDGWSWDKPAAGTIADTILKEAANLPGARIRS